MQPSFTIGIEEEYQTIDPETRDLRSHIASEIIEKGRLVLQERIKPEMHPFSDWRNQEIYPDERYHNIVEDLKMVARANLIFGLHVHIGVEDREVAIHLMNAARYFVPPHPCPFHKLALLARHGYRTEV